MSERPYPISDALRGATYSVSVYAAKIMRQDDEKKVRYLIRQYKKAAEAALVEALASRGSRMTATRTAPASESEQP